MSGVKWLGSENRKEGGNGEKGEIIRFKEIPFLISLSGVVFDYWPKHGFRRDSSAISSAESFSHLLVRGKAADHNAGYSEGTA
jgi:ribosomal protein L15